MEGSPIFWATAFQHSFLNPYEEFKWKMISVADERFERYMFGGNMKHDYLARISSFLISKSELCFFELSTFLSLLVHLHYHVLKAKRKSHGTQPLDFDIFNSLPPPSIIPIPYRYSVI